MSLGSPHMHARAALASIAIVLSLGAGLAPAQDGETQRSELDALRREVEELRRRDEEYRRMLEALEQRIDELSAPTADALDAELSTPAADALDAALEESTPAVEPTEPATDTDLWSRPVGNADVRLIDLSLDVMMAGGWSSVGNDRIEELQAGAHDPNQRGFTLQQAEISFAGAVDPYFTAAAYVVATDDEVELEEAFATTTGLPYGLQLEAGYFLTEFGIINPRHAHAWHWVDQPLINSRLFGGEGLRSTGFRLGWLLPTPWFSQLDWGLQSADPGCCAKSFLDGDVGGRPSAGHSVNDPTDLIWLARWSNSWDLGPETTSVVGLSGLYGPNSTGGAGETWIYGMDLKLRWRPDDNFRGFPFVEWQTEIMKRDYRADGFVAGATSVDDPAFDQDLASETLDDAGGYTQLLWGFRPQWAAGLRFEYAGGSGGSVEDGAPVGRDTDPRRDDRLRISPLLTWWPTHFSRLRLQYNYDDADHLPSDGAHSFWLSLEVQYGRHGAHDY